MAESFYNQKYLNMYLINKLLAFIIKLISWNIPVIINNMTE